MPHSFETLSKTKVDDLLIMLAKLGLFLSIGYGMQTMAITNIQHSGSQTEYRRKEDDDEVKRITREELEKGAEPHRIRIRQRDSIRLMVLKKCREFARQSGLEAEVSLN